MQSTFQIWPTMAHVSHASSLSHHASGPQPTAPHAEIAQLRTVWDGSRVHCRLPDPSRLVVVQIPQLTHAGGSSQSCHESHQGLAVPRICQTGLGPTPTIRASQWRSEATLPTGARGDADLSLWLVRCCRRPRAVTQTPGSDRYSARLCR
jgi:hypothetical protein